MGSVTSYDDIEKTDIFPKRPARKKKSSSSGGSGNSSKMSISSSEQSKVRKNSLRRSRRRSLKKAKKNNVNQWKRSDEESSTYSTDEVSDDENSGKFRASNGDIYTKVAMPRSKSFMKMNNNQGASNYNLQDLFKELKDQVPI